MIFVVLGTWEMPFTRPLAEIEDALRRGVLTGPVIVQCGNTKFPSTALTMTPFFGKEELERMYDAADVVICQAGVGSIMLGLRKGKKVIAIARRHRYHEHIDDHQLEILNVFSQTGAVLPWDGEGDLGGVIERLRTFVPAGYNFAPEKVSKVILDYLNATIEP